MGKVEGQFMILLKIDCIFNSEELAFVQEAGNIDTTEKDIEFAEA
jgi:hypothetical protein